MISRARFLFRKAKIQLAQPYMKNEQQSENTSGRHSRVDQSGVSTAISEAKSYLARPYINSNQQSENTSGTAGHDGCISPQWHNQSAKRKYNWHSRISTTNSKAKTLLDGAAMSTRAVCQPRSANRKGIWHRCISTAISKANPSPGTAAPAIKSENTTGPAVYQQ